MSKRNCGFTVIEVLLVIAMIVVVALTVVAVGAGTSGNFWYTDAGVLREIKADHPMVTEVVRTTRNVFDLSVVEVKENGVNRKYCLNTNVLWNYEFTNCQE